MAVSDTDLGFLRRAIALSHTARSEGNPPFGSLLVGPDGTILAERTNTTNTEDDISAHPEFKLSVWAARTLPPEQAAHTTMYTSCENCAMCSGAMVWSGLRRLVYALSCAQMATLQQVSVPTLNLASAEVFARADRPILSEGPALYEEAVAAHEGYW